MFTRTLKNIAVGATAGVGAVIALPIFGAVGTITAAGVVVGSLVGAAAGVADSIMDRR
jgi:hypothetical protein